MLLWLRETIRMMRRFRMRSCYGETAHQQNIQRVALART